MDNITTKFEYLLETKDLIKQAIIDKGVTVSDTDTFRSYADKISSIENTTLSVVATDDVCRKNLCYWMDAIDNRGIIDIDGTRSTTAGNWWSKSGFCYFAPYKGSATTTWNEDSVTYNSSFHGVKETTPLIQTFKNGISELTYEITFSINSYETNGMLIGNNLSGSGGCTFYLLTDGSLKLYYWLDSAFNILGGGTYYTAPLNTKIYLCGRIKQGLATIYASTCGISTSNEFTSTATNLLMCPIVVGYHGNSSGAYESQQANINVNSFRIYNRYITDEEMSANCKYEVTRFNIPEYRILTINSNVEGATVTLTADGYTQTDNYIKVLKGTEVAYSVFADGYTAQTGTVTVNDTKTIDITL